MGAAEPVRGAGIEERIAGFGMIYGGEEVTRPELGTAEDLLR